MYDITMPLEGKRQLPSFNLRQEDLPEILKWEVGGQYYIVMKVEMTGLEKRADLDSKIDKTKMEGGFKVHSIRALGAKPVDATTIEKEDFNETVAKVKSGDL